MDIVILLLGVIILLVILYMFVERVNKSIRYLPYNDNREFYKFLSNKSGFDRQVMTENLEIIKSVLDRYRVFFWLGEGTALGAIREGRIIENDTDNDIGIYGKDEDIFFKKCIPKLEAKGFWYARREGRWGPLSIVRKGQYTDVDIYEKGRFCYSGWPFYGPTEASCMEILQLVEPFSKATIDGTEYNVPSIEYIEKLYGKGWRIPNKDNHGTG